MSRPMIGWCKALEELVPQAEDKNWAGTCHDWEAWRPGAIKCSNCVKFRKFKKGME